MKKAAGFLAGAVLLSAAVAIPVSAGKSDPTQIFFTGGSLENPVIYQMDAETTAAKKVTNGSSVDVSPDGKKLAFIKNDSVYVSDINGKNQVRLTNVKFPTYDASPRWSPDGTRIAFSRSDGQIYVIDVKSKQLAQLTTTEENVVNSEPDWSPEGDKIVFHSNRTGRSHIFIMNADGSDVKQLTGDDKNETAEYGARFSPDGSKIVYGSTREGNIDIYVMNADGSRQTNLTADTDKPVSSPVWSSDGQSILYSVNGDPESGEQHFYLMDKDGSGKTTINMKVPFAIPSDWQKIIQPEQKTSSLRSTIEELTDFLFDN
ncbi:DPP IV N-terminal domain-containing protein [Staphylospora marina]|uniref:DPP IV N-terminal domain-containing protein n=1 Tax=Staphylospora marina TaxID=2490858 RepID=UPI000F5BB98D|nr:DPP IV N-terminal domain-containing protein [Staphylospora marina]